MKAYVSAEEMLELTNVYSRIKEIYCTYEGMYLDYPAFMTNLSDYLTFWNPTVCHNGVDNIELYAKLFQTSPQVMLARAYKCEKQTEDDIEEVKKSKKEKMQDC